MSQIIEEILKLSVPERIVMVEAIWDTIEEKNELLELGAETKQLLDKRLDAHYNNPKEGSSWADVKSRIRLERR
jgi:putative addiction module component (TIGR02574 family)